MKSFVLFTIFYLFLCEINAINEQTVPDLSKIISSVSSELGTPESGSTEALPGDIKIVYGELLGYVLGGAFSGVDSTVQSIKGFFQGFDLADGNILRKFACGLYEMGVAGHDTMDEQFVKYFNAIINAAGVDTPPIDFQEMPKECPKNSIELVKEFLNGYLQALGYVASVPGSAIGGAEGAVGGIIAGLSNSADGNLLDSAVKGFGTGFGEGIVNSLDSFSKIKVR